MTRLRNPIPFLDRPRRWRKAQAFAVRQLFSAGACDSVGFVTDAALDAETCIADIVFLSPRDKGLIYHGRLFTAAAATLDLVDDLAAHYAYGPYRDAPATPLRQAAFAAERVRLLAQHEVLAFAGAWLDRRCPHAVGVEAILEVPALTAEAVLTFIERFWDTGERGFASPWALAFPPAVLDERGLPPAPRRERLPAVLDTLQAQARKIEALPRAQWSAGARLLRRFLPRE